MKRLSALIFVIISFALSLSAMANDGNQKQIEISTDRESFFTVSIDPKADIYIETVDGLRYGTDPESGKSHYEIQDAAIVSDDNQIIAVLPQDTIYLMWLKEQETDAHPAFNADISTGNWSAELTQLFPLSDNPTLVFNAPDHYYVDEGFTYEKLTILAQPDAFPAIRFNSNTTAGECTLTIDPTFSLHSADSSVKESEAQMVITLFPDFGQLSLWIAALDNYEAYEGSRFLMNTRLICNDGSRTVSAKSLTDFIPVLNENGIMFFDFKEFLERDENFFSGDLNGDDIYETTSAAAFFEFETE